MFESEGQTLCLILAIPSCPRSAIGAPENGEGLGRYNVPATKRFWWLTQIHRTRPGGGLCSPSALVINANYCIGKKSTTRVLFET